MSVTIGNGSGFWGDRIDNTLEVDYLTLDYLSEMSLSIMAVQREKDPNMGYAADFLQIIPKCKIVTNAGGLNPLGLALEVKRRYPKLKIGIVSGDDVLSHFPNLSTANAYLGAEPIVEALRGGADIVITGRVADPSLTVACAQFHFGWDRHDYDKLAQATVAGHLIECGAQVTGGLMDDWLDSDPAKIGYPILEMFKDASFKLKNSTIRNVKEQLVYEIQDPGNYLSPDVTANFLDLHLGDRITGAKGKAPPSTYKVSGSIKWGYTATSDIGLVGDRLKEKAEKIRSIILDRLENKVEIVASLIGIDGLCPYLPSDSFEALLRLSAKGKNRADVEAFTKELAPFITCGPMGVCAYMGGRSPVRPLYLYRPELIERVLVKPKVEFL